MRERVAELVARAQSIAAQARGVRRILDQAVANPKSLHDVIDYAAAPAAEFVDRLREEAEALAAGLELLNAAGFPPEIGRN